MVIIPGDHLSTLGRVKKKGRDQFKALIIKETHWVYAWVIKLSRDWSPEQLEQSWKPSL
jgi:hypothetical protein